MANERINLDMSVRDMIKAMSGDSAGASMVCWIILLKGGKVDPDSTGGLSILIMLDALHIYEERIYMLWRDVCGQHIGKTIAVLRAHQLGLAGVNTKTLNHAIDNRGADIDLDAVMKAVKNHLPNFNPEVVV